MDFNKEFDAIFKDVVGNFEERIQIQQEEVKQQTPYQRYEDYAKDLVRFSKHILKDEAKLNMYGIQHVLHYLEMKKYEFERNTNFTCKCGKVWSIGVWNEPMRFKAQTIRSLESLGDHIEIFHDPYTNMNRVNDMRFCAFCGQGIRVEGIVVSMVAEGTPLGVNIE